MVGSGRRGIAPENLQYLQIAISSITRYWQRQANHYTPDSPLGLAWRCRLEIAERAMEVLGMKCDDAHR